MKIIVEKNFSSKYSLYCISWHLKQITADDKYVGCHLFCITGMTGGPWSSPVKYPAELDCLILIVSKRANFLENIHVVQTY